MFQTLETIFTRVNRWIVGLMLGIMFILVFTNVVTRYCFNLSLATAEGSPRFS